MSSVVGWQNVASAVLKAARRTEVIDAVKQTYPDAIEIDEGPVFGYWISGRIPRLVALSWLLHSHWAYVILPRLSFEIGSHFDLVVLDENKARIVPAAKEKQPTSYYKSKARRKARKPTPQAHDLDLETYYDKIIRDGRQERLKRTAELAAQRKANRVIHAQELAARRAQAREQTRQDNIAKNLAKLEARRKERLARLARRDQVREAFRERRELDRKQAKLNRLAARFERKLEPVQLAARARHLQELEVLAYSNPTIADFENLLDNDWDTPHSRADEYYMSIAITNGDGGRRVSYENLDIGDYDLSFDLDDKTPEIDKATGVMLSLIGWRNYQRSKEKKIRKRKNMPTRKKARVAPYEESLISDFANS